MKNIRCGQCNSLLAKEEDKKILIRTGFGKHRVFHLFDETDAVLTCWNCKEVKYLDGGNNGHKKEFVEKG